MPRRALLIGVVVIAAIGACRWLMPTVNAPLRSMVGGSIPLAEKQFQERARVPDGFEVGIFATGLTNARFMRGVPGGDLLVTSPRESKLFRVEPDRDGDGRSDGVHVLADDLYLPHGVDYHDGWIYLGLGDRVERARYDPEEARLGPLEKVVEGLPNGGNHWTKTVRVGPDGMLYVSIGSTCNVCEEDDARRATIQRYALDGSGGETFASGLRNAVGFDWQPETGALYATDNGRDLLGDDFPPCELNRVESGGFYGWPYVNGDAVSDPDLGGQGGELEARAVSPAHGFVAHTAPLGITFYRGDVFPEPYRSSAFVAQHGSWNRSRKSGYKVVRLEWDGAGAITESDFLTGLELDEDVIGRPVDVVEGADGALYVSDDYTGVIYRVAWADG